MHETFDHTADLGLRIVAPDLNTLFAEAGQALFATIIENPDAIRLTASQTFEIAGENREFLFYDWLRTLLYQFDAEHWLFGKFEVVVRSDGLSATVWGELLEPERHERSHEVKAITYHALRVEQTPDGWLAEVIVDI